MAITIGHKIYLYNVSKKDFLLSKTWVCHELKHVQQFQEYGFFNFMSKYLWASLRTGYYNNRFEIEARNAENDFNLLNEFEIN